MGSSPVASFRKKEGNLRSQAILLAFRLAVALAFIAAITFAGFRLIPINATTVAFAYLVAILMIAAAWGLVEAVAASVIAMLCFNFFFLPPIGTLTIANPQNWVALFAFLITSLTASQLSARAKRRTEEAIGRQNEMERLYGLSRAILLTGSSQPVTTHIARQIARIFQFSGVVLYDRHSGEISRQGPEDLPVTDEQLRETAVQGTLVQEENPPMVMTAINLGGEPIGSVALGGLPLSSGALQALSNLVAIGLEKARAQEAANQAEAARQSQELKSTLLDAIAHEFKTPLTSIRAATTALLSGPLAALPAQHELVTIIDEESDRLARLVTEAIHTARIEAGKVQLNKELHSVASLVSKALQQMKPVLEERKVTATSGDSLPLVFVDGELIELVLRQLIDNAVKYSPAGAPLAIHTRADENQVMIGVADEGPGIPEPERSRIFERFHRGADARHHAPGSGMGLSIAREILQAHGGSIWMENRAGGGSQFWIALPVTSQEKMI
ncbi:MAG TPA: ATP-binding protein [Terriglobia bacterium]|nr:ATP-binding protein [Terriglobia bacterium]